MPISISGGLAQKVADAFPDLSATDQRIAVGLYRLLAEGKPVSPDRLAQHLDLSAHLVKEVLDSWPAVYFNDESDVIGFWGLALQEMPHRFKVNGRQLYTWCAWDSLFIPELLGKTAEVESTCPTSGEIISLTVSPTRVENFSPEGAVVSFLSPTTSFDMNVIAGFCHYVLFFSSEESGKQWIANHEGTFLLTLEQAHEIGRLTNKATFGAALKEQAD
jgi:alkylmercury lyase